MHAPGPVTLSLALALQGPFACYGTGTHERYRPTAPAPTKSAVCGLLAACLGRPYGADLRDLFTLAVHVRIDEPGTVTTDFQTVRGTTRASGAPGPDTFTVSRDYLQGSAALVVVCGDDALITQLAAAVRDPTYLPYLGTRNCVPSRPLWLGEPCPQTALDVMAREPALSGEAGPRQALLECAGGALTLADQPLPGRGFTRRQVRAVTVTVPPALPTPPGGCP